MKNDNYDPRKRSGAITAATLRGVVAIYIGYLVYNLIGGVIDGTSTLSPLAGWLAGAAMAVADGVFIYFIWRCFKVDMAAARIPDQTETEDGSDE